ncbi:MAG: cytochrome-c oxidase [Planctomycetes bacterium RBG_16_59_8]|nr:MAG: cytochrome-c oxidase [Planctomycetes bacterium RBG_16_59_8]
MNHATESHPTRTGTFILVWCALLALTGITVAVADLHFGYASVLIALIIASFKAALVLDYFMHLKYEERLFKIMLLVAFATLAVVIGLTFLDTAFR